MRLNFTGPRKIWLGISALVLVLALAAVVWQLVKQKYGDVRPAIQPPTKHVEQQPLGEPIGFDLKLPAGFQIALFAKNLGNARDLLFTPGGTLLLSIPASGKVVGLPDQNGDGKVDEVKDVLTGLSRPHGLAFRDGKLYVAEETRVMRYAWSEANRSAAVDRNLFSLPAGGRHFTRSLEFDRSGRLFVSLGSSCDTCVEAHPWLAAVIVWAEGGQPRLYARGLRNAVFLSLHPETGELWGTEMGRDFLGDNKPPDEIDIIRDDSDYGWPYCFGDKVVDTSFAGASSTRCANSAGPTFQIPAHSAPLGLSFVESDLFPNDWQKDLLVAYHGSWNRSAPIGYKVVHLKLEGDRVLGEEDFITGFLQGTSALGRPVDLTFDQRGRLYISDDKTGAVYVVWRKK